MYTPRNSDFATFSAGSSLLSSSRRARAAAIAVGSGLPAFIVAASLLRSAAHLFDLPQKRGLVGVKLKEKIQIYLRTLVSDRLLQ